MKTITILMLFSIAYATPRSRLRDCEEALQKMTLSKVIIADTTYITERCEATRKDVKIAKQSEKTKRRELITQKHEALAEIKAIKAIEKSDNKVSVKTSVVYQLGTFAKGATRAFIILIISSGAGGAFVKFIFDKIKSKII
tara:strand:- start:615 stop:1037 length:423 start_codon:yes stop_codon:yes gene_type:complete